MTDSGYTIIDPLVAILIGILILRNAFSLVRESTDILMEATPRHLKLEEVARTIQAVDGVIGIHDLHIWTNLRIVRADWARHGRA